MNFSLHPRYRSRAARRSDPLSAAERFEAIYQPQEPRGDGLRLWAIDLAAGVLWLLTCSAIILLVILAVTP